MPKNYNTPKRTHIVKTRLDDEEHADFLHQVEIYGMNQSEFIREAISGATIRPVIVASNINDARQKYRDKHEDDFVILNAAKRYFDSKGLKKLPSYKALQSEVEQLIKEKNALYNRYHEAKERERQLSTIRHNIEQLRSSRTEHKQEQER